MGDVVVIRNVDKELYKRLKSIAALKGYTIGRALNEAIRLWLSFNEVRDSIFLDYIIAREKTQRKITELLNKYNSEEYKEKYIVVCDGKYIGIYDNINDARKVAAKQNAIQCTIVKPKEGIRYKEIELGMGVLS